MSYPGGKAGSGVYQTIINQIPPHDLYIEPFLGDGAIMRYKKRAGYNLGIDRDPEVIKSWENEGIEGIRLHNGDAFEFLAAYKNYITGEYGKRIFIYIDPPYLLETRSSKKKLYNFELSRADHIRLLELIKDLSFMVMISGYASDLYFEELKSWRIESFQTVNRSGKMTTEIIWMNYPAPVRLHDYSFLGNDFTDRQRIKRKINRWVKGLRRLPVLERQAILKALDDID